MNKSQKELLNDIISYIGEMELDNFFQFIKENPTPESVEDHIFYKSAILGEELFKDDHFLCEGTKVEVDDPEGRDDENMWSHAFVGTIKKVVKPWEDYIVADQEGDCYSVKIWDISGLSY